MKPRDDAYPVEIWLHGDTKLLVEMDLSRPLQVGEYRGFTIKRIVVDADYEQLA